MRLYLLVCFSLFLISACSPLASEVPQISVTILVDGDSQAFNIPLGSSVGEAIDAAGIELGDLDRTEPAQYSELSDGDHIQVIRVTEEFETEQVPVAFESRTLQNESLAAGEQRLIQNGANGLEEVTYRLLYEDGELVSRTRLSATLITAPVEEIIMIGAQSPFSSVAIDGRLAFISGGNAWVLEDNSGARRPVVITGDLDGRVFEISPNGEWLLFTRQSSAESEVNELWVASLEEGTDLQIDLRARNIVHYAGWVPGTSETQIAYSTVEPSSSPPGWQANNDLLFLNFTETGEVTSPRVGLPARFDSLYSWWGTNYAVSENGELVAFARPDAVGLVDIDSDELDILLPLTTYQTSSDWAWIPGISWSPDGGTLYTVEHAEQQDLDVQEQSPIFDLVAIDVGSGEVSTVAENIGMFAQPQVAPDGSQLAFLRAFIPSQSDISAYELMVAAPDGASLSLFPPQGAAGLQPQRVAWSPAGKGGPMIAFIYQGNLWVVNIQSGEAHQITGDGLVSAISWR